ncbi:right-handed parallel beta-helix repeat-containing protein [Allorhizocola rhizosphaerae]|uniref:right-handed parallel beta-helix repeat-containing protein n=1 Tax=Allorhizocola rhizosphaerae TaxID=1872709 RepID=UPI0013C2FE0A|nr:right-handed parallel beta-helix repeat-containing protein [Allorhizocola rhizosphaerae]
MQNCWGATGNSFDNGEGTASGCEITEIVEDGLLIRFADPEIRNGTIADCGYRGVHIYDYSRPMLENCSVERVGDVGIDVAQQSSATIRQCRVREAPWWGHQRRPRLRGRA